MNKVDKIIWSRITSTEQLTILKYISVIPENYMLVWKGLDYQKLLSVNNTPTSYYEMLNMKIQITGDEQSFRIIKVMADNQDWLEVTVYIHY